LYMTAVPEYSTDTDWFTSHINRCIRKQCIEPKPVKANLYYRSFQVGDDFKRDVFSKFTDDDVGKLCTRK